MTGERPVADFEELASLLTLMLMQAHNEARGRALGEAEQRAVWSDPDLAARMRAARAETVTLPVEAVEIMVAILRGEVRRPRGRPAAGGMTRALRNLARETYEERLARARLDGEPDAKEAVLEGMAADVGLSPDRISQLVWPRGSGADH